MKVMPEAQKFCSGCQKLFSSTYKYCPTCRQPLKNITLQKQDDDISKISPSNRRIDPDILSKLQSDDTSGINLGKAPWVNLDDLSKKDPSMEWDSFNRQNPSLRQAASNLNPQNIPGDFKGNRQEHLSNSHKSSTDSDWLIQLITFLIIALAGLWCIIFTLEVLRQTGQLFLQTMNDISNWAVSVHLFTASVVATFIFSFINWLFFELFGDLLIIDPLKIVLSKVKGRFFTKRDEA